MRRRPAPRLAELQAGMQAAILSGEVSPILTYVRAGAHAPRETMVGVYTSAYWLRLVGVLTGDFPLTAAYLGDAAFERAARSYIAAHPSPHFSARWVGDRFPDFLRSDPAWSDHPEAGELATLEWVLGLAFDAADAPALSFEALTAVPAESWSGLIFTPHPSAVVFVEQWNAFDIWSALKDETEPPRANAHPQPLTYLVWRRDGTPAVRRLEPEEAMLWREAGKGVPFARLCELSAAFDDPATAPLRVATLIRTWIDTGALAAVTAG